jgi:hypothetical protein
MAPTDFALLQLLHGVQDRARLGEAVASLRSHAPPLRVADSELFAGDAIEKGQTGPDRRVDLSGDPLFLVVTPLDRAVETAALHDALAPLAALATRHESWVVQHQFDRRSDTAQARPLSDWLQIVMMNVDPPVDGEFNEWYEREHVARIAAVAPEFVSVRRMQALAGSPRYFALWRLTDRKAPERDPWLSASETPWTTRIRRFMRDRRRLLLAPYAA